MDVLTRGRLQHGFLRNRDSRALLTREIRIYDLVFLEKAIWLVG
jgi:hypothetical protein